MSIPYDEASKDNAELEIEKNEPSNLSLLQSKITSLSLAVETLTTENNHLMSETEKSSLETTNKSEILVNDVSCVNPEQKNVCAREIARKAEIKAMNFVFPDCRKKPYCLRSYKHLISFVSNPTTDNTSCFAPIYWSELDDIVKSEVKDRIEFMKINFMYLKTYIQDLNNDDEINNTMCANVDELKVFLMSCDSMAKDDLLEALSECIKFNDLQLVLTSPSLTFDNKCEITGREIAIKAEEKAMDFVFPECRKKPYCLRSYGNLVSFVSNPTDEYTGHNAPAQWAALDELVKQDIRSKIDDVSNHSEYLKTHIKDLKYGGELTTQVCSNVDAIKELLRTKNEEDLLESLEECLNFLEVKLYSNIIIKQYHNNIRSFGDEKPLIKVTDETSILSSSNIVTRNTVNFLRGFSRGF
jgi:hypothetical protein